MKKFKKNNIYSNTNVCLKYSDFDKLSHNYKDIYEFLNLCIDKSTLNKTNEIEDIIQKDDILLHVIFGGHFDTYSSSSVYTPPEHLPIIKMIKKEKNNNKENIEKKKKVEGGIEKIKKNTFIKKLIEPVEGSKTRLRMKMSQIETLMKNKRKEKEGKEKKEKTKKMLLEEKKKDKEKSSEKKEKSSSKSGKEGGNNDAEQKDLLRETDENFERDHPDEHDNKADYTYGELLERVVEILHSNNPDLMEKKRRNMKPPQLTRVGTKKTLWVNFQEICTMMQRNPEHVFQFFMAELGTEGSIDGNQRLVIRGKYVPRYIESLLRKYIVDYVTCQMCRSPNTELVKDQSTRLQFINCKDCGSSRSVAAIRSGYHAATRADRRAARNAKA